MPGSILNRLWKSWNVSLSRLECGQFCLGLVNQGTEEHMYASWSVQVSQNGRAFPAMAGQGEDGPST